MTTYLSFLSWYLASAWSDDENQGTRQLFDRMYENNPGTQCERLERIVWGPC